MSESTKFFIFIVSLQILLFAFVGWSDYLETSCRIELAKTSRSIDEIEKLCN